MATLHIIDDTSSFRRALRRALEASWLQARRPESDWPTIREWGLIWELTAALDAETVQPTQGDIAITDLYPSGYWPKVKQLRHKRTLSPTKPLPGDPTNMYRAVLDVRRRFLPVLSDHHLAVVILTYVPHHIERIKPERSPLTKRELKEVADRVRAALDDNGWTVVEKNSREVDDPSNVTDVVAVVNDLLEGRRHDTHGA
jgi:hypothetical protein